MSNGGYDQLTLSRRRRPENGQFLLVEMPSEIDTDGAREELLAMYEAVEGAARGTPPAAMLGGRKARGNSSDGDCRRSVSLGSSARFVCPYFGVLRVKAGGEEAASRPQESTNIHTSPKSSTRPCEDRQEKTRLFLALGDPREGMRSPCSLAIKIDTGDEAASVPPASQVNKMLDSQRYHVSILYTRREIMGCGRKR